MQQGRIPNQYRVYGVGGVSPTLSGMDGGGRQPCIVEDFFKDRPPRITQDAPTLRSGRSGLKVVEWNKY